MALGLQSSIAQVDSVKNIWVSLRSNLPGGFVMNGLTIEPRHIDKWFDEIIRLLNSADQQENPDMLLVAIHFPGVTSQCQSLATQAASWPSNPVGYLPSIASSLWGIKASLLWILPLGAAAWETWPSRSAEMEETLGSISKTYQEAVKRIEELNSLKNNFNLIQESLPSVKELTSDVQKVLQEVANSKASAEGSATNAAAKKEEIDEQAKLMAALVKKQNEQLEFFEEKKDVVEKTLAGASAIALGSSFDAQNTVHMDGKKFWTVSFYVGLAVIVAIEMVAAFNPSYFPPLTNEAWLTWLLSRIAIVSPVIWFTWFAALQYSRAMKLAEDYAFKTAAAKSFYGYRKEVGADEDLLRLLQETSIKNFGSNPLRLLGDHDHGSPTQEIFEKMASKVDKETLVKFIDSFKEYVEKIKVKKE